MYIIAIADLTLRPIELSDAPRFAELVNDFSLAQFTSSIPHPYTLEDAKAFVALARDEMQNGAEWRFAVCRDDEIIACVGLRKGQKPSCFELGYWVGAPYRGRGVATRAAEAVVHFGFETLNADKVTAGHFEDNPSSGHILRKIGFRPTGETVSTFSRARNVDVPTARYDIEPAWRRLSSDIAIAKRGG